MATQFSGPLSIGSAARAFAAATRPHGPGQANLSVRRIKSIIAEQLAVLLRKKAFGRKSFVIKLLNTHLNKQKKKHPRRRKRAHRPRFIRSAAPSPEALLPTREELPPIPEELAASPADPTKSPEPPSYEVCTTDLQCQCTSVDYKRVRTSLIC